MALTSVIVVGTKKSAQSFRSEQYTRHHHQTRPLAGSSVPWQCRQDCSTRSPHLLRAESHPRTPAGQSQHATPETTIGGAQRLSSTAPHKNRSPRRHTSTTRTASRPHPRRQSHEQHPPDRLPSRPPAPASTAARSAQTKPRSGPPHSSHPQSPSLRRRPPPQAPSSPRRRPLAASSSSPELQPPPAVTDSPSREQASAGAEKKQVLPPPAPGGLCPPESTGDGKGGGG
jgi:hypothetical protein